MFSKNRILIELLDSFGKTKTENPVKYMDWLTKDFF